MKNKLSIFFDLALKNLIIIYFFATYVPYFVGAFKPLRIVFSISSFSIVYRCVLSLLFFALSIYYVKKNRNQIYNFKLIVIFSLIAIFLFAIAVSLPQNLYVRHNIPNQNTIIDATVNIGLEDRLVGFLNSLFDIYFAFFVLFNRKVLFDKKRLNTFLLIVLCLGILECLLTFALDFSDYKNLLVGNFENIYKINISGTFQSKNGLGFFLFQSVIACIILIGISENKKHRILYFVSLGFMNLVLVFTICKTSIIISFVLSIVCTLLFLIAKKNKIGLLVFASCLIVVSLIVLLIVSTKTFDSIDFIFKLKDKLLSALSSSTEATIIERLKIWYEAFYLMESPYLFFGYSSKEITSVLLVVVDDTLFSTSFHNGFICVLTNFGVLGLLIYLSLIGLSFNRIIRIKDKTTKLLMTNIYLASLMYTCFESLYLFFNGSPTISFQTMLIICSPYVFGFVEKNSKIFNHEFNKEFTIINI